ncbi:hypothetical protein ACFLV1_00425 [Chloroflexota bacterium]
MVEQKDRIQRELDELTITIDEYRTKIDEIVRREKEKVQRLADEESNHIIERAWQKAEGIIADGQAKADQLQNEIGSQTQKEAGSIIREAKQQAEQIVSDAEERIKKEAKSRTNAEVEKIINHAREEYRAIIAKAHHDAEKQAKEIIGRAEQEKEKHIREAASKYEAEAQKQSDRTVAAAREQATRVVGDVSSGSADISRIIADIMTRTENLAAKFKEDLQVELGESTKMVAEARQKLERVVEEALVKTAAAPLPSGPEEDPPQNAVLSVLLKGKRDGNDDARLFNGQMEIRTLNSYNYLQIRKLRNFLVQVPNIKFVEEYASEKGTTILFEVKEPLPLLDILSKVPGVETTLADSDGIRLVLKN